MASVRSCFVFCCALGAAISFGIAGLGLLNSFGNMARAIADINGAVERLGDTAQQNAALVEEANSALDATDHEASRLDELASQFRLERPARAGRGRAAA
jgi:methyl-accepting chemotaxis protein